MHNDIRLRMDEQARLLTYRFHDLWMTVTGVGHTNPTGKVKILSSIGGIDVTSLGALGFNIENTRPDRGHMGKIPFKKRGSHRNSGEKRNEWSIVQKEIGKETG
jgi:hypothetical protein